MPRPVDPLELVLDIEQPYTHEAGHEYDRHLDKEVQPVTEGLSDCDYYRRNQQICHKDTFPFRPARTASEKPVPHRKQKHRPEDKQHNRISIDPVSQPLKYRHVQILINRHGLDIPGSPAVQISNGQVMCEVRAPPVIVSSEGQGPADISCNPVGAPGCKKRAVTAVVEKNKDSDQEQRCGNRQNEGKPVRIFPFDRIDHQYPEGNIGDKSIYELPDCLSAIRLTVI